MFPPLEHPSNLDPRAVIGHHDFYRHHGLPGKPLKDEIQLPGSVVCAYNNRCGGHGWMAC